ncbi:MAG: glycosyltransferase [Verrucomicrobiota bacterium]
MPGENLPLEVNGPARTQPGLVSVIVPCYRQSEFLPQAIKSILGQTYSDIEAIVVDDGSPDETGSIVAHYPQIRYLRQENQGLAAARNAGFHLSAGSYVIFLDADDQLTPNAVKDHLSCFADHPDAGFVVGDIDHVSCDGAHMGSPRWPLLHHGFYRELLRANHVANTIAVMFKRKVLQGVGGFCREFNPAEDYHLLLSAARLFPSAHHRNIVALYRRHGASMSRQGLSMLTAMDRVMRGQRAVVLGDPQLEAAWEEGDAHWRDRFGKTAIREFLLQLSRFRFASAAKTFLGVTSHLRGRIFLLPWKFRGRAFALARQKMALRKGPPTDRRSASS